IEGRGLFARASIAAGEAVSRLGGRLVDDPSMRAVALEASRAGGRYSALQVDEGLHLLMAWDDPASRGNHSCDPNLWMAGATTSVARRDIEAGEEVTTDYALFTADEAWSMPCACHSAACRGTVRGSDWRRPELQARYRGHFTPFLERRIEAIRR
ncbi:MAG: SET domain-containing protein-lysine N-methyltransferase, partial [Dehalococcoidia bacterium]|nr:SET domain-containing protein-lysine N-methyltransferase [Dehalococcoidia bacterium]